MLWTALTWWSVPPERAGEGWETSTQGTEALHSLTESMEERTTWRVLLLGKRTASQHSGWSKVQEGEQLTMLWRFFFSCFTFFQCRFPPARWLCLRSECFSFSIVKSSMSISQQGKMHVIWAFGQQQEFYGPDQLKYHGRSNRWEQSYFQKRGTVHFSFQNHSSVIQWYFKGHNPNWVREQRRTWGVCSPGRPILEFQRHPKYF